VAKAAHAKEDLAVRDGAQERDCLFVNEVCDESDFLGSLGNISVRLATTLQ